jgi:hypothetical protein
MRLEIYDANKLNFVELNTTGDNDNYIRCDEASRFVDMEVFNIYAHCFEEANKLYEYYEPTKYNSRKIVPLRNALLENLENLNKIDSKELFVEFIGNIFLGKEFILSLEKIDKTWDENWGTYIVKLRDINLEIIEVTEDCIENEKILWVVGY